jgi:hypothetical protein
MEMVARAADSLVLEHSPIGPNSDATRPAPSRPNRSRLGPVSMEASALMPLLAADDEQRAAEELVDVEDDGAIRQAAHVSSRQAPQLPTGDRRSCLRRDGRI